MSALAPTGIARVARGAGFTGQGLAVAVAVCLAESGGDPGQTGYNAASVDRGLWQINSVYHAEISDACAYDAACNARAAYAISHGGADWTPWATFNSGAYLGHLATAYGAVSATDGGGAAAGAAPAVTPAPPPSPAPGLNPALIGAGALFLAALAIVAVTD